MASASASQSTLSTSPVSSVSQPSSSPAATVGPAAPSSTTPRPASTSSSTPVVAPRPTTPVTSTSTSSSSSSSSHASQATVFVPQPPSDSQGHGGGGGTSSIAVVAPIVAVAGILIIVYIAYRIYLLHKRRKDEKVPLPPPRVPAIFERPQSVMYANPPMMGGSPPPSYRQSVRPVSMLYNPGSSSSSLPTKGGLTSASGHTTPTQNGFSVDENGRQSPMLYPQDRSLRGGMPPRPHSVASFGSNRYSSYGTPRTPYMNRVEVVLPQPLAGSALSSASARQSRFSTYNGPPNPDMRPHSMILPPLAVTPDGDWAHRVTTTAEERASSSMDHSTPAPPPPPKDRPRSAFVLGTSSAGTSRDHGMQGAFSSSPTAQTRSVSPPEPLLASGVFASSSSSGESDEAAKPTQNK